MDPSAPHPVRDRVLARLAPRGASRLTIGGVEAEELVRRFGSPLYVHDARILREQFAAVRGALGERVEVLHCLKANPGLALAEVLREAGAGAEVASAGEILIARAAGHPAARIHFSGPGKSETDLRLALEEGLGCTNLESSSEYRFLAGLARQTGRRPRVALRVNPPQSVSGTRMLMGGASKKFGVDAEEVPELAARIVAEDVAELVGLHVYAGTQCFDASAWLENAHRLVELANAVERRIGQPLRSLNFGGGFGVPYYDSDPSFDLAAAGRGLEERIALDARPDRRYFVELGRSLVAESGVYLASVRYLKESHGRRHAILDGGMHHHGAAAGVGAVLRRSFPVVLCRDVAGTAEETYTLGGPLCTPADELASQARLPPLREGDVLAFLVSGAYGLTFSSTAFLSHPTPAEVLVDAGEAFLSREAGRPEDGLRGQHPRRIRS